MEAGVGLKNFVESAITPKFWYWFEVSDSWFGSVTELLRSDYECGWVLVSSTRSATRLGAFRKVEGLVHVEQDRLILGGELFDAGYAQDVFDDLDLLIVEAESWKAVGA